MYNFIKIKLFNILPSFYYLKFGLLLNIWFITSSANCQSDLNIYQSISDYKGNSIFYIAKKTPKMEFNPLLDYYWFMGNDIHISKGCIGGKPLNAGFTTYYLDNNLKEKGSFYFGLKNAKWMYWFANGNLHKIENYKKGLLQGAYNVFNDKNQLIISGEYRNNLKHGKWISFYNNAQASNEYTWEKGRLHGKFIIYDSLMITKGNYFREKLDGKYKITYSNKKDSILYFKDGIVVIPKEKSKKPEKTKQISVIDTVSIKKPVKKSFFFNLFHKKENISKDNKIKTDKAKTIDKVSNPTIEKKKTKEADSTQKHMSHQKKTFFGLFPKKEKNNNEKIPNNKTEK